MIAINNKNTDKTLIATAILHTCKESRLDCKVIDDNIASTFVALREGSTEFIVCTKHPNHDEYSASFFPKYLEPICRKEAS
ncbi:hypothetical protein [Flavobacterium sp. ACAM 123]|jgi:hypothetical protein|uniref:hypothetical protein n=1 Tax=Flavobacterium sp. ACAM 123 TaxID=1189620 RepID=UPI0003687BF6|nr:hypothetical protein [Flavobacterium sp. ACAM 123]